VMMEEDGQRWMAMADDNIGGLLMMMMDAG